MLVSVGQAGLRAVHDLGPEIRRAISGNLEEEEYPDKDIEEPMHRVNYSALLVTSVIHLLDAWSTNNLFNEIPHHQLTLTFICTNPLSKLGIQHPICSLSP